MLVGIGFGVPLWVRRRASKELTDSPARPSASLATLEFWTGLNRGNYAQSWETTAPMFQRTFPKDEWVAGMKNSGVRWAGPCPAKRKP